MKIEQSDIMNGSCTIPDGVTGIGNRAFYGCRNLESITLPGIVTNIGNYAFARCESLRSVTIPDSATSIGNCTFYGCRNLESITLPDSVTDIGDDVFEGCKNLESITLPNSVTSIGNFAFFGCETLKSITLPDRVTSIGTCAFEGCKNLESITLPDSIRSMNATAFKNCGNLRNVMFRNKVTEEFVQNGKRTEKAVACFGPDVAFTVVPVDASEAKHSLTLTKDKIKATAMEGVSYARIGLNSEYGKYGTIYFETENLLDSKKNPNVAYLPMEAERGYNVVFSGKNVVPMTGADIVSANKAFIKESNRQRTAKLEARVQEQSQTPQQQGQAEM